MKCKAAKAMKVGRLRKRSKVSASAVRRTKRNSRHGRISRRRYQLLRDKYLRVRQERSGRLDASSYALRRSASTPVVCECCLATIQIDEYGDSPQEKCKECQRVLCSSCCFASEKAPLWYCGMCVVTKRLIPIWRPTTEGMHDCVLSVSFQVRRQGRVYGEANLA